MYNEQVDEATHASEVEDRTTVNEPHSAESDNNIVVQNHHWIYAGFWLRFIALTLDIIALYSLNVIVRLIAGQTIDNPSFSFSFFEFVYGITYYVACTALFGQTLGKMVMGIKVIRESSDRSALPFHAGVALYRELVGKFLSLFTFGIGFMMAGWSRDHRALHDMMCDTFVVLVKERENVNE